MWNSIFFDRPEILALAQPVSFSKNLDELDACLDKKDYEAIIKNADLFWLAYCKALVSHQGIKKEDFFISLENKKITVLTKPYLILIFKNVIEEIREFLLSALEGKTLCEIFLIEDGDSCYLRKKSPMIVIDFSDTLSDHIHKCKYEALIKPVLPQLAEFCGASYSVDKEKRQVKRFNSPAKEESVEIIRMSWRDECRLLYPIAPKIIPKREKAEETLYPLYQSQQLCNYSLAFEGGVTKVHLSVLYAHGESEIQKLLISSMKESNDKTLHFKYSESVVKAFIEFIYLGGERFSEQVASSKNNEKIDLMELLSFAHAYKVDVLFDCCVNLVTLFATKENLDDLRKLAALYRNKQLEALCEYFQPKESAFMIKV